MTWGPFPAPSQTILPRTALPVLTFPRRPSPPVSAPPQTARRPGTR